MSKASKGWDRESREDSIELESTDGQKFTVMASEAIGFAQCIQMLTAPGNVVTAVEFDGRRPLRDTKGPRPVQ